jgi:protein involved in polysaccharide export with SLBB domain
MICYMRFSISGFRFAPAAFSLLLFGLLTCHAQTSLPVPSTIPAVPATTPTWQSAVPAAATTTTATAGKATAPGLLNGYVPDDSYKLRVGDAVSFQIEEDQIWDPQNTPKILVVQDSGELELPYVGRMMAVGKTCKELAVEIKAALEKDYYKKATVVMSMNVASPILGRVYVWGQVHNQGPLDIRLNENLTVGQAIMRAGGFADFANQRKVRVIRSATGAEAGTASGVAGNTPQAKQAPAVTLDMEQILNEGKTEKDIVLQPGDLIIVPSKLLNF